MKLKTLVIVILALAAVAGVTFLLNRPDAPASANDTRISQPLVHPAVVEKATRVEVSEAGRTVRLRQTAPGVWEVESYHGLPADFSKLSTLVNSLTSAKVERFVTQSAERLARLELADTRVAFLADDGRKLHTLTLGKNAEGGGRFVQFGDEKKAYLSRVNVWLDATDRNWANTALLTFKPDDIASVTLTFPDAEPLTLTRADKSAAWTPANLPAGQQLKTASVTTLLTHLGNLRFTEISKTDAPEAVAAREHARSVTLKTFAGRTYTVQLGRQPERTIIKPDVVKPNPEKPVKLAEKLATDPAAAVAPAEDAGPKSLIGDTLTEKLPAGPVFASVKDSDEKAAINALMTKHAFQVAEFVFTSLPAKPADWFEPVPKPAEPATPPAAAPASQ